MGGTIYIEAFNESRYRGHFGGNRCDVRSVHVSATYVDNQTLLMLYEVVDPDGTVHRQADDWWTSFDMLSNCENHGNHGRRADLRIGWHSRSLPPQGPFNSTQTWTWWHGIRSTAQMWIRAGNNSLRI